MQLPSRKFFTLLVILILVPVIVVGLSWTGLIEAKDSSSWQGTENQIADLTGLYDIFIPLISNNNSPDATVGPPANEDPQDPTGPENVGTGFEIDGNTALDMGGDFDWESDIYPPANLLIDPNSKSDRDLDTFKPDGKFDEPENWKISPGKVGPPQTELTNLVSWFVTPNSIQDGKPSDAWLIMGMERTKENGSFYLDFEYNQMSWDGSDGGLVRTPGDLLVGFGILGNPPDRDEDIEIMILQFLPGPPPNLCTVTSGNGPDPAAVGLGDKPCPPYGTTGWYYRFLGNGATLQAANLGRAAVNETPFPAPPPPWQSTDPQGNPRDEIGPFQFMEAELNLTNLGLEISCSTFASVHAKGRASLSINSDLKDLAGPQDLVTNCRIEGHKFLDVDGNGQWDQPQEPGIEGWEILLNQDTSAFTDENGFYSFEYLADGTYTVTEVCPPDWVQTFPGGQDVMICGDTGYEFDINLDNTVEDGADFGNGLPQLDVTKSCPANAFVGDTLEYQVEVVNSGNVIVSQIEVEDSLVGILEAPFDLAPGESKIFNYSYIPEEAGELINEVTANGSYGPAAVNVSGGDTCTTQVFELTVSKDVQMALDRIYLWNIAKTSNVEGPIVLVRGDWSDVFYEVTVDLVGGGPSDSNWQVSGNITIDNPAPMAASLKEVRDEISGGFSATVDCPSLTVPAGGTLTCTYGPQDLPDGQTRTNTAIAVLNNDNGGTTEFSGSAPIDFADADVAAVDESVTVTDSQVGFLGEVRFDETPKTFAYMRTVGPFHGLCGDIMIDNLAKFITNDTGTEDEAREMVDVFNICVVRIGFEDLKIERGNDWDYNDLVLDVQLDVTLSDPDGPRPPDVLAVGLDFTQYAGPPFFTRRTHAVNIQPTIFTCDGTYTKIVTNKDGTVDTIVAPYTRDQNIQMYANSGDAPQRVQFMIEFDVGPNGCPVATGSLDDPLNTFHGEALFFAPWILIRELEQQDPTDPEKEVRPGDPRMLAVPDTWQWPAEKQAIWLVYPCVIPGDPPIFTRLWWRCGI